MYHIFDKNNNILGYLRLEINSHISGSFNFNNENKYTSIYLNNNKENLKIDQVHNLFCNFGLFITNLFGDLNYKKNNRIKNVIYYVFDNIFWNFNIIKKISFNKDESKKITDELINKIINMKYINNGLYYKTHLLNIYLKILILLID